jgi:hypothetical protein
MAFWMDNDSVTLQLRKEVDRTTRIVSIQIPSVLKLLTVSYIEIDRATTATRSENT